MDSKPRKIAGALKSFWFFSSASILMSFAIAIWVYRLKFGGALSGNSSDWSNFGSYMGGIFGPLVSFITLLAVLKTVYLQRELLDAQKLEFSELRKLQLQEMERQDQQLEIAKFESERMRMQSYQATLLELCNKLVEQKVRYAADVESTKSSMSILEVNTAKKTGYWYDLDRYRKDALKASEVLTDLSIEVLVNEFGSFDELKRNAISGLQRAGYPLISVDEISGGGEQEHG